MDLTFQVPMQYCSLQHQTLLLSPVTSTSGCCICFGSISSFFLELFLYSSPVAYWAPTDLGNSSFRVISFCLFILFMGFSRQEDWSDLTLPSPVDHIFVRTLHHDLSNLGGPTSNDSVSLTWTRPWAMWSAWLFFCDCGFYSVCPLMDKVKRSMEASYGREWPWGKLGLVLMGGAMLSTSLVQFSVDGWGCVPFPVVWP